MHRQFSVGSFVLGFLFVVSPVLGQTGFRANLNEAQSGGTGSMATGDAFLILNADSTELSMTINFDGISTASITAFHIHDAPAGQNGGVVFGLISPNHDNDGDFMDSGNTVVSEWDGNDGGSSLASQLTDLMNSGLYFNVHTSAFPGGEIRGQIEPAVSGDVNLDGAVNLLDVQPFVDLTSSGGYQIEADVNLDGVVNLLDVQPFVGLLAGGG